MKFETIAPQRVEDYIGRNDTIIIDLRSNEEYRAGHIPTAVSIPYRDLEYNMDKLYYYKEVVLYCDRGNLSLFAARDLSKKGYQVVNLCGGIHSYRGELSAEELENKKEYFFVSCRKDEKK